MVILQKLANIYFIKVTPMWNFFYNNRHRMNFGKKHIKCVYTVKSSAQHRHRLCMAENDSIKRETLTELYRLILFTSSPTLLYIFSSYSNCLSYFFILNKFLILKLRNYILIFNKKHLIIIYCNSIVCYKANYTYLAISSRLVPKRLFCCCQFLRQGF